MAAHAAPVAWDVVHARSHAHCPSRLEGPAARVFADAGEWDAWMTSDPQRAVGEAVDWQREQLVVFLLPMQRSLGHAVEPAPRPVRVRRGVATLRVKVVRPAEGDMVASALSTPCLVLKGERQAWRRLIVRDASGGEVLWRGRTGPAGDDARAVHAGDAAPPR